MYKYTYRYFPIPAVFPMFLWDISSLFCFYYIIMLQGPAPQRQNHGPLGSAEICSALAQCQEERTIKHHFIVLHCFVY